MNDFGVPLVRLVVGGFMLSHSLPKLDDSDHEYAKSFERLGFRPGATFVMRAAAAETSAAVLIGLGAFGPIGPTLLLSDMIVAMLSVAAQEEKFDPSKHELEALYGSIAAMVALSGPGRFAMDRALGIDGLNKTWLRLLSLASAAAGAAFMLSQREPSKHRQHRAI